MSRRSCMPEQRRCYTGAARRELRQRRSRRRRRAVATSGRTLRQKDWQALRSEAFLAGERPAPSGPTEGASGRRLSGAANLSGKADSEGKSPARPCRVGHERALGACHVRRSFAPRCKTPLHALHLELGAKMVPFAGYDMPVAYPAGILAEHRHCRDVGGAVRRLAHGPAAPDRRRCGARRSRRWCRWTSSTSACASSATRFFTNAQRRHPRRPDDHAARRPTCSWSSTRPARRPTRATSCTNIGHRCTDRADARARAARAAGPDGSAGAGRALNADVAQAHVHDRRVGRAGRRRLLRHALGLHRRRRLRDLGAGRRMPRRWRAALLAEPEVKPAGLGARDTLAPRSRPVPVRPRHRRRRPRRSRPA